MGPTGFRQPIQQPYSQSTGQAYQGPLAGNQFNSPQNPTSHLTAPSNYGQSGPNLYQPVPYQNSTSQQISYNSPSSINRGVPDPQVSYRQPVSTGNYRQPLPPSGFQTTPNHGGPPPTMHRQTVPGYTSVKPNISPFANQQSIQNPSQNYYEPVLKKNTTEIAGMGNPPSMYSPDGDMTPSKFGTQSLMQANNDSPYYQMETTIPNRPQANVYSPSLPGGPPPGAPAQGNNYSHYKQPPNQGIKRTHSDEIWEGINTDISGITEGNRPR
jgi:hypothetical protein